MGINKTQALAIRNLLVAFKKGEFKEISGMDMLSLSQAFATCHKMVEDFEKEPIKKVKSGNKSGK